MKLLNKILERRYRNKTPIYSAIDLGKFEVRVVVFKITPDSKVRVLGVGRHVVGTSGVRFDILESAKAAEEAINRAEETAKISSFAAITGVEAPAITVVTTPSSLVRDNPDVAVGEHEMIKSLQTAEGTVIQASSSRLLRASISGFKLDGRKVNSVIGHRAHRVDFEVYNIFAKSLLIGEIETIIEDLGLELVTIMPTPQALSYALSEDHAFTGIIAEVGSSMTTLTEVNHGQIENIIRFGIGGRDFTEAIARELSTSSSRAEELKINYSSMSSSHRETNVSSVILDVFHFWAEAFELAEKAVKNKSLLSTIVIYGGGSTLPEIKKFMRKKNIRYLVPEDFTKVVNESGEELLFSDIGALSLAAALSDHLSTRNSSFTKSLAKVLRVIEG